MTSAVDLIYRKNYIHLNLHISSLLQPATKYFDLILCILEFRFCIFEGRPFMNYLYTCDSLIILYVYMQA